MPRTQSVVNLDPIDRKKNKGFIGRLLITRWSGGEPIVKSEPFGHYMFCGPQGSSKTASALWYTWKLQKKYKKRCITYLDHSSCPEDLPPDQHTKCKIKRYKTPPKVTVYSNLGLANEIKKTEIYDTIDGFDEYANEVRIVIIDEIHTYFPKDGGNDRETISIRNQLLAIFSQLRKRNTYILSTAQVYGRLHKALREQCLYMVNCSVTISNKMKNEFIPGDDIVADDLGRWSGDPFRIYTHGLAPIRFDTKRVIRE